MRLLVAIIFVVSVMQTAASAEPKRPLIVVPGIVGSVLEDESGEVIWGDIGSLNRSNFSQLDLLPEAGDAVVLRPTDALRDVPVVFGLIQIGVYSKLIDFFTGKRSIPDRFTGNKIHGDYTEGQDLFVFAYDWRRSNFASAKRLNDFIEEHVPSGEYDLVAHSMGGIVTRLMLDGRSAVGFCGGGEQPETGLSAASAEERNKVCNTLYGTLPETEWPNDIFGGPYPAAARIHLFIEMATPHFGSNNMVGTYLEGWGALSRILIGGRRKIQNILLAMAAPVELAPVYDKCCARGRAGSQHNREIIDVNEKLSFDVWSKEILGFGLAKCPYAHCDLRKRVLAASLENRKQIHGVMQTRIPPSVKSYLGVVGRFVDGTRQTVYFPHSPNQDGAEITFLENSDGDGTVHRVSALPPEFGAGGNVSTLTAHQASHEVVFDDESVQKQIYGMILNPLDQPIAGVAGRFEELFGKEIESIGLQVAPQIALSGDQVKLTLKLKTTSGDPIDDELVEGSNRTVRLEQLDGSVVDAGLQKISYDDSISFPSGGEVVFTGAVAAPAKPGVYSIIVVEDDDEKEISRAQLHVIDRN